MSRQRGAAAEAAFMQVCADAGVQRQNVAARLPADKRGRRRRGEHDMAPRKRSRKTDPDAKP